MYGGGDASGFGRTTTTTTTTTTTITAPTTTSVAVYERVLWIKTTNDCARSTLGILSMVSVCVGSIPSTIIFAKPSKALEFPDQQRVARGSPRR